MARAVTCTLTGRNISVDQAIRLRDSARLSRNASPDFRCIECGEAVRPHSEGGHAAAHFEHLRRNANCQLSHPLR